nr:AAA family ATPase [Desertifilum sp. SIO1I2]
MYVKCLKMQNFRGISDLTLDFESNQPTVFIGINGVGKSSILDCLAILFSRLLARIQHEPLANKSVIARLRKQKDLANGKHFNDRDLKNNSQSSYNKIEILLSDSQSLTWSLEISREGRDLIRKSDTAQLNEYADRVREQYHKKLKENIPLTVYYSIHRYVLKVDLEFQEGTISRQIDAYENSLTKNNVNFASFSN